MPTIADILARHRSGVARPSDTVRAALDAIGDDPHKAWITVRPREALLAEARALEARGGEGLPLFGVPFAVKDNIDVAGVPTTAACPAFASTPGRGATVVERLVAAGAIPVGKTNLDQFATGLNGTRSPYGACRNAFDRTYVSGGSSSGSAVATALGHVAFALGTDTAGSGRVPAAFNNLVGLKPTKGLISTRGVVPAMRAQDVVSIFAGTAEDAALVASVTYAVDAEDPYSRAVAPHGFDVGAAARFRLGVPAIETLGLDADAATLFAQSVARLVDLGAEVVTVDVAPMLEAAKLLYGPAFVAERTHALRDMLARDRAAIHPVVRAIVEAGATASAVDVVEANQRLRVHATASAAIMAGIDVLLLPTTPRCVTIAAMEADPVGLNSMLGTFTNFVNLLDMAAVAVPAGFTANGLPWGVTFIAGAHQDGPLLGLAARWQAHLGGTIGATSVAVPATQTIARLGPSGRIRVAVCGAHMSGLPLNKQLLERDGRFIQRTVSSPDYKLHALPGGPPFRPGMVRVASGGAAIELEVWDVRAADFGSFVEGIPAPLGIGRVTLADGTNVAGFVCEAIAAEGASDITHLGGWRAYLATKG